MESPKEELWTSSMNDISSHLASVWSTQFYYAVFSFARWKKLDDEFLSYVIPGSNWTFYFRVQPHLCFPQLWQGELCQPNIISWHTRRDKYVTDLKEVPWMDWWIFLLKPLELSIADQKLHYDLFQLKVLESSFWKGEDKFIGSQIATSLTILRAGWFSAIRSGLYCSFWNYGIWGGEICFSPLLIEALLGFGISSTNSLSLASLLACKPNSRKINLKTKSKEPKKSKK